VYGYNDEVVEDEVGGACSLHFRFEKCLQDFDRKLEGKILLL